MWIINNVVVPEEIISEYFLCPLSECKGMCCVAGDAGAPLEEWEIGPIEDALPELKAYMDEEGWDCVEKNGVFDYEIFGNLVTLLKPNEECVFVTWENGHTVCAIEKAHNAGATDIEKPVSCHLYPLRIERDESFDRITYHRWNVCRPAIAFGKSSGQTVFDITAAALARKYGDKWVDELRQLIRYGIKK